MTRYFTKEHEWVEVDGQSAKVGITDYAQSQLGDITFVELPAEGAALKQGDSCCVVDSVKAASDVYAPVSGTVTANNASWCSPTSARSATNRRRSKFMLAPQQMATKVLFLALVFSR